ncbi:MAG: hypothetical protein GDA56_05305 [Hormoscilla sp. GM7CHS1pb]|nr:hypothetical protein [Hormoscilla sp. GM7CHS1pb]
MRCCHQNSATSRPLPGGGWSTGSLIAFEMAWQLQQEGEIIDRLVLIDLPAPLTNSVKKAIVNMSFLQQLSRGRRNFPLRSHQSVP